MPFKIETRTTFVPMLPLQMTPYFRFEKCLYYGPGTLKTATKKWSNIDRQADNELLNSFPLNCQASTEMTDLLSAFAYQ